MNEIEEVVTHSITAAQQVLLAGAEQITLYKMQRALGLPTDLDASCIDMAEMDKIWAILTPILKDTSSREKIDATSKKDITKALAAGKIGIDDALKLMQTLKVSAETEAIKKGKSVDALGTSAPGVNIAVTVSEDKKGLIHGITNASNATND